MYAFYLATRPKKELRPKYQKIKEKPQTQASQKEGT